jgi:integrase
LVEPNKKAALAVAQDWEHKARNGLPVENPLTIPSPAIDGIPTFRAFTITWVPGLGGECDYRAKMNGYMDNVGLFLGPKADWPLHHLPRSHFLGLAPFLSEMGYSLTTVTLHLKALRAVFLVAERRGFILASPITPADYLANPSPIRPKALAVPQIEHLLDSTGIIDWRTMILLGFYCGMDLVESGNHSWVNINLPQKTINWAGSSRNGEPAPMTLPMHPVLEAHLAAVRSASDSEFVTPKLHGMTDCGLREQFRLLVERSGLKTSFNKSRLKKRYFDIQFSSLKLAFAHHMGYEGLFRLARFLRGISAEGLQDKIAKLPTLKLRPLPLLNRP